MAEKTEVDERLEPLKKMLSLNSEQLDLIANRNAKEAEFKAFLRAQDKAIEEINERQRVIAKTLVDADMSKMGHVSDELRGCLEGLGIKLDGDRLAADKETKAAHTENYKGFISGEKPDVKARVVYGNSIDEVLDKAAVLADKNKKSYTTVNIGGLNKSEGQYMDYRRFDIASRYDISPVYLSLPHLERDEFKELTKQLKDEGAKFNTFNKSWYIPHDIASKEVFQPYISEPPRQRDYSRQRNYTSQELALPVGQTGKTVNDMLSRNDGYVRITYEDNGRGRIAPNAAFYENSPDETEQSGRWLAESKVRTLVIGGNEMSKNILYPGEGFSIDNVHDIKTTPFAAIVEEQDASGKFYSIYGIHDISGMICRLSPRRFDTQEQCERNIPDGHRLVSLEKLKAESKIYEDAWAEMIKDDIKNSGYDYSCCMVKNIKMLNYETNKSWSLKDVSAVYKRLNGENMPEGVSELAEAYIKRIGDECADMQRMEIQTAEIAQ